LHLTSETAARQIERIMFAASGSRGKKKETTNASLFTTLLGGGLIAWMLLFMVIPASTQVKDVR
jgi:hypothetical protein